MIATSSIIPPGPSSEAHLWRGQIFGPGERSFGIISFVKTFETAFVLVILLSGCGGGVLPEKVETVEPLAEEEVLSVGEIIAETPAEAPYLPEEAPDNLYLLHQREFGDLDEMLERRYIRLLVVHNKTLFFYDRGRARGVAAEAGSAFEQFLNKKFKTGSMRVHIVFVPVARDQLIPNLAAGLGDIAAANLTITPERQEVVDFSDAGVEKVSELVVTGPSSPELTSIEDLSGQQVHVRASSSYYEHLQSLSASLKAAGKAPIQVVPADERLEDEDILEMVNAGMVGITVIDSTKGRLWGQIFNDIRIHNDLAVNTDGRIAWAFRKGSPKLAALINEFVKEHRQGTSFGNTVLRRYYRNTKWVRNATSSKELEKFRATVKLFQHYSDQYDFDWLMIAAQAYQESRLNNNAKNPSGAVGIMQVLPTTAAGSPINIADVLKLENNVHAGVKILRHYRDQYFNDPEMDERNQTLMAFAGYNAGPNRINRLRKKTAEAGLDPNKWFRNVERTVAKEVGREPVQYVSNVYKYYIAYKMVHDAQR
jgi:membrane-bound lytic murein transglycosylase MltF